MIPSWAQPASVSPLRQQAQQKKRDKRKKRKERAKANKRAKKLAASNAMPTDGSFMAMFLKVSSSDQQLYDSTKKAH